jgi:ectoine hydroxylase-related dioxygenase (phytanoyl-CoA dioxygenase family)
MYSFGIDRFADNKFPAVEALSCSTNPNLWVPTKNTDESRSVPCPVKAGQASLHDGWLIHGSEPNTSYRRRCGYAIRYVSTSAKPIEGPDKPRSFPCAQLVCGEDCFKHLPVNKQEWSVFYPKR